MAAGGWTTCARTVSGDTWCWGYGERGTLGDGNFTNSNVPVQTGIDDAQLVAVGRFMACVKRPDESVWCWGDTAWIGENQPAAGTPRQGNKSQPTKVAALTAGRYTLLLDQRGRVWWWSNGTNPTPEAWPVGP